MKRFKGRGLVQLTGKHTMATINLTGSYGSPVTLTQSQSNALFASANASSVNWQTASFGFEEKTHSLLKKYEVYESVEPILALSSAAHRIFRDNKIHYKLTDRDLFGKVTPEDKVMADQIKDYYSKKVMMWKLKGNGQLSPFRDDMNKLIHSDGLTFKESMIGIAYWLPVFYQYDIDMDLIKMNINTNQNFEQMNKDGKPGVLKLTETLTPIKRLDRKTKRSKLHEYWFKSGDSHNAGVVIHLEEKNQLQHLWDKLFNLKEPMKIEGFYSRRRRDDFEFYSITNWSVAED